MLQYGLQLKYAVSYFAVILICLAFINVIPVVRYRDLLFESKSSSMQNQASLIASSLSSLNALQPDEVKKVMELLNEAGSSRVIVTDGDARVLYDSMDGSMSQGRYVLYSEIILALEGKNVFYARLRNRALIGKACVPVVSRGGIIGTVYLYVYDAEQAALVTDLQSTLRNISLVVIAAALMLAVILSLLMTGRIRNILSTMRSLGEGDYEARAKVQGKDTLEQLSREVNVLADRLQQTEAMRQRFVSDASHELKTPLAAITLLADSIVQTDGMPMSTVREFVYDIGREAERLRRVTQRLLELSRLHNGNVSQPERVDLRRVSQEALKMLRPLAEERDVKLESSLDEGCIVLADPDDLHEVIFNLAENAIKYNVPGGQVRVLLYRQEGEARLLVDDTGIGIAAEKLPNIFDRFYRVDESRTGDEGSSGLGLSIVKETVEKHGGRVEAQRREGGGMRFAVSFPLLPEEKRGRG
jgi:signal transduction histidine kinase